MWKWYDAQVMTHAYDLKGPDGRDWSHVMKGKFDPEPAEYLSWPQDRLNAFNLT